MPANSKTVTFEDDHAATSIRRRPSALPQESDLPQQQHQILLGPSSDTNSRRMSNTAPMFTNPFSERRSSLIASALPVSNSTARRTSAFHVPVQSRPSFGSDDGDVLPSSPTTSEQGHDPLLALSPADLRRPSFSLTTAATLDRISGGKPSSAVVSFSFSIPRRLIAIVLSGLTLIAVVALFSSQLPSPRHRLSRRPSNSKNPSSFLRFKQPPRAQQDVHLEELLDLIARDQVIAAGQRLTAAQPVGESRHLLKRITTSTTPTSAGEKLVMTDDEVREMQKVRKELLWGPAADLHVETIEPKASEKHESTVIFIHGLAQHVPGDALLPNALAWRYPNTRWVSPQAPTRNISLFSLETGGTVQTPGWFDMHTIPYDTSTDHDDEGFFISTRQINTLIAKERARLIQAKRGDSSDLLDGDYASYGTDAEKRWASKRIVLSGFSQGGAMSLLAGLTNEHELGGLAVFSTFLPLRSYMSRLTYDLGREDMPVYWGHGTTDPYLTYSDAATCISLLSPSSASSSIPSELQLLASPANAAFQLSLEQVQFSTQYGLAHATNDVEILEAEKFLDRVLTRNA
ncbi:hypothetical protein JCM8547_009066 [Rhodosporidiobolus lusitaniae]